jgi:hypothetical protein
VQKRALLHRRADGLIPGTIATFRLELYSSALQLALLDFYGKAWPIHDVGLNSQCSNSLAEWGHGYERHLRNWRRYSFFLQLRCPTASCVYSATMAATDFRNELEPKLHDYQTVEFLTRVAPGKRADLLFEVVRKQGTNAKQNNFTLEAAAVKP